MLFFSFISTNQLLGIAAAFVWTFGAAFVMFKLVDKIIGLRVSAEEEREGLDLSEHGGTAYPDFEVLSYSGASAPAGRYRPRLNKQNHKAHKADQAGFLAVILFCPVRAGVCALWFFILVNL